MKPGLRPRPVRRIVDGDVPAALEKAAQTGFKTNEGVKRPGAL